jgi:hypothetical protein
MVSIIEIQNTACMECACNLVYGLYVICKFGLLSILKLVTSVSIVLMEGVS